MSSKHTRVLQKCDRKINLMKSVDRIYYYCIILLYVILKVNLNSFYFKLIIKR